MDSSQSSSSARCARTTASFSMSDCSSSGRSEKAPASSRARMALTRLSRTISEVDFPSLASSRSSNSGSLKRTVFQIMLGRFIRGALPTLEGALGSLEDSSKPRSSASSLASSTLIWSLIFSPPRDCSCTLSLWRWSKSPKGSSRYGSSVSDMVTWPTTGWMSDAKALSSSPRASYTSDDEQTLRYPCARSRSPKSTTLCLVDPQNPLRFVLLIPKTHHVLS